MTVPVLVQQAIRREAIAEMLTAKPRRMRLCDWKTLLSPSKPGGDQALSFPFIETFANLVKACPVPVPPLRRSRPRQGKQPNAYCYLPADADVVAIQSWVATLDHFVVCRDLLAVSMALDFDREDGDPAKSQTAVAKLRSRAKPYDREATADAYEAAQELGASLHGMVSTVRAYDAATMIASMPASKPGKKFDLPARLGEDLGRRLKVPWEPQAVMAVKTRPQLKEVSLREKLAALDGTFTVDAARVQGHVVLLVDDLYQSGASMNFVAMKLQEAGAKAILGAAVEKTVRNDDNTRRR